MGVGEESQKRTEVVPGPWRALSACLSGQRFPDKSEELNCATETTSHTN